MRGVCQVSSLCLVSALAAIAGLREAEANCSSTAPASNETVICDSNPPNPFTSSISAQPGSTNVTVNVLPGAILSTGVREILVVNASSVLNQGEIHTSASNAFGVTTTGNGSTLTNEGTITTTGLNSNALDARGSNSTLINSGTIDVSGTGAAGIRSRDTTGNTLITNSGSISSAAGSGILGSDTNTTVRNSGNITAGNGVAINLGDGNNVIEITGGQITGDIVSGAGNDQFIMSGGIVTGNINLGSGSSAVTITGGEIDGSIVTGAGTTVTLFTGSTTTGPIQGDGTNALVLDGAAGSGLASGPISNFQTLTKQNTGTWELTNSISGATAVAINGGTLILSGDSTYTGGTTINAGTLQLGNGGSSGSIVGDITNNGALAFNRSDTFTFPGVISGTGALQQIGTGTTILTGNNTYTGDTTISAGALIVNGSIASSSLTTVNSGASLLGTGTVGTTIVKAGGFLAPGNSPGTMTVAGNLAFESGAFYIVQVNPTTASATNVSGTASLAGTVGAIFLPGAYVARSYTILTAAGGRTGTFDALTTLGLPPNFQTSLSYTGNTVLLNLTARLVSRPTPPTPSIPPTRSIPPTGLPISSEQPSAPPPPAFTVNQFNVGHAIDNFFNNGGALPPAFLPLFGLTGNNLTNALDQLSGEPATGAQKVAFQLTDQFLNVMLDPFVDGRSGVGGAGGPALGFAPERDSTPPEIALAYASVFKAPQQAVPVYEPRWTVWGGSYGGSNRTTGDGAIIGSHDLAARTVGVAGGFDYHLSRDSIVGLAFAGGGTNWSLSQGLGGGKSDAFQAGVYGATRWGPAYVAAALAFTNHWMSTDRFAFAGDHLTASFNAQSFGGRVESGYRFATIYGGLTPYAAIQAQSFHTPGYSEADLNAGGFALGFNSRNATDTRSELGGRFDRLLLLNPEAALTLRARVAWAHDWVSDPTLVPMFQALPGASFIVNGATLAKNSALTSAGAELRLANGVALLAKFDGEFASHSSTYAGTGTVRYSW
jgi:autotransporter-associated beta strand protein